MQIALGMGAADRAALPPQAACRFGGVVVAGRARGRHSRQGEEGPRLVERRAQRRRAGAVADEVEQIAVLAGRGVGPLSGHTGAAEADEERPPAGAVEIARDPVAALLAAVREIAPADGFGLQGRARRRCRRRETVRAACGTPSIRAGRPIPAGLLSGRRRRAGAPRIARARRPNGSRSGSAAKKRPAPKCRPRWGGRKRRRRS